MTFKGSDFANGSQPYVYDKVLAARLRSEFENSFTSDAQRDELRALVNFLEDNMGELSTDAAEYITGFYKPLAELHRIIPASIYMDDLDGLSDDRAWEMFEIIEQRSGQSGKRSAVADIDYPASAKRTIDGYEELSRIRINQSEIILAENPDAEHRYMVVENRFTPYYNLSGDNNIFTGHTNDYLEALDVFTEKTQSNIGCVKSTRDLYKNLYGIEPVTLTADDCIPGSDSMDYTGKLIIVKAEELMPEYRTASSQLVLCSHGNGARPNAKGTSVFGTELSSGESVCYGRHEIAGIADPAKLPEWVAKKTAKIEAVMQPPKKAKPTNKKPSLLGKLDDNKQKVERDKAANKDKPKTKKRRDTEVTD
jgi:hypothetical protein